MVNHVVMINHGQYDQWSKIKKEITMKYKPFE